MQHSDYRQSHQAPGKGKAYRKTYERGYYAAQWRDIEGPLLRTVLADLSGLNKTCLDFACGTGRIASVAAQYFGSVTAVDVSPVMLEEADVPSNVELLLRDITLDPLDRVFDVILAFRFFLNADDALRTAALRVIRSHLKDDGRLVCNIHMAQTSPMGRTYDLMSKILRRTVHRTMHCSTFTRLIESEGFAVENIFWYSFLPRPGPLFPRLCEAAILPLENLGRRTRLPRSLAQSFLVVARKR
jgi:SAM-dependent methyltransferase